jgi:hypothetical protein
MVVEEAVVGMGGGDAKGVSYFTSSFHYASADTRCVAVAA